MSTGTDISAIYREFTDALTEILAENAVGPVHVVVALRGHVLPSRSTLSIVSTHTSWRWRPHSRIGKTCKTSVVRPAFIARQYLLLGYSILSPSALTTGAQRAISAASDCRNFCGFESRVGSIPASINICL
jgi:hypothetical protein